LKNRTPWRSGPNATISVSRKNQPITMHSIANTVKAGIRADSRANSVLPPREELTSTLRGMTIGVFSALRRASVAPQRRFWQTISPW
jgi:hypothetical protein